jgi:hypothetical protein
LLEKGWRASSKAERNGTTRHGAIRRLITPEMVLQASFERVSGVTFEEKEAREKREIQGVI